MTMPYIDAHDMIDQMTEHEINSAFPETIEEAEQEEGRQGGPYSKYVKSCQAKNKTGGMLK